MTRRLRLLPVLLLICALVMPMTALGSTFTPRAIDRYYSSAMFPPLADQKYFGNIGGMVATADGQFLWVTDQDNDRLLKVSVADGSVVKAVGRKGDGNGQFYQPAGIARAENGDLLVCDMYNNRVQVLDSSGAFKSTFGWQGNLAGQMWAPVDIAIDPGDDSILVSERFNNRVQRFNGTTYASMAIYEQAERCQGIAVAENSEFYVVLPNSSRVRKYNAASLPVGTFGSYGGDDGQFMSPDDVSIDATGNVIVSDEMANNAQKFTPGTNVFIEKFGSPYTNESAQWEMDYLWRPRNIALVASQDKIYFSDYTGIKWFHLDSATAFDGAGWTCGGIAPKFMQPTKIACWSNPSGQKAVWVMSDAFGVIRKYLSDAAGKLTDTTIQISNHVSTSGFDVDGDGNLYLAESGRVYKSDQSGSPMTDWAAPEAWALDVATVEGVPRVYVTDKTNEVVKVYSTGGVADATPTIGVKGNGTSPKEISDIKDVAVTPAGVFVLDSVYPMVKRYHPMSGAWELSFGSAEELGYQPMESIESDRWGNIYLTISATGKVLKYSGRGVYLGQIGSAGTGTGELSQPWASAVSPDLHVFVAERGANRVQTFRPYNATKPTIKLNAVPGYNTSAAFSVDVLDAFGQRVDNDYPMQIRWSNSATGGWSTWSDLWGPAYGWSTPFNLTAKKYFQVRSMDSQGYLGGVSAVISASPRVLVSNPVAPSTMSRTSTYSVWGTLKPRHTAGTYPVRIYKYRLVGSVWRSYGYVNARATNYSTYSRYTASVKLPYAGKWKLRAYAPADSLHAATWSSGYDEVLVK